MMSLWPSPGLPLLGTAAVLLLGAAAPAPAPLPSSPAPLRWIVRPPEDAPGKPPPPTDKLRMRGRSLYDARCADCHGERGDGRGPLADKVQPRPTDFRRAVYKVRSTPTGSLPTPQDIFQSLSRGHHGTAMKPWEILASRDRWALVILLESFSSRFAQEPPARPFVVPLAPRETSDILDHGELLYVRLRCGACHGDAGAGDGPAREAYRRQGDREVRIRDFTRGRFIRGREMEDIYLTLRAGIDGTPMGAYDGLPDDQLWALAAYVRALVRDRRIEDFPPAAQPGEGDAE